MGWRSPPSLIFAPRPGQEFIITYGLAFELKAKQEATQTRIATEMANTQRAVQALQMLIDGNPVTRCVGARILGDLKQLDPSGELDRVAATDPDTSVRDCANAAIASIKEANPDAFRRAPD